MEVIGLIAAIPGLIEITQKTISIIRAFTDQKSFAKQIIELLGQLELIEKILQEILNRLQSSTIHHSYLNSLITVTGSLKSELIALGNIFQPLAAKPGRKAKVLNRIRLLIHGLEGKIKGYHERLDKAQSALTLVIVAQNDAVVQENLTISRSNLRLKLNDVLLPSGYSFIPQNLQGTCEWIWTHPVFCEWQKDPTQSSPVGHERRIMCIHGPKGCGKSVLAASIVEKLKSQDKLAVGFSFWAGSHNQQKLLAFLRTFLWHIIQHIPDDNLAQISAPLLESLPLTERILEDVISIAVKVIKPRIYCIIDGIDESVDDWTRPSAGGLRLALDLTKAHTNLRVILLGRDASMRSASGLTPLIIEITEDLIRPDINQLILYHLDSSLKVQDAATRQLVQETLQESSRVMFLWVTLIFGALNRCHLPSEIEYTLHRVPRDLDREYHRLFICLQDRLGGTRGSPSLSMERAKCLLTWIVAAPEPLTYEELRCAFAISQCPDKDYGKYMISEEGIVDTCGDFIRVSDGRYHMAHASIEEFLTRPIELWQYEDEAIEYFRIDVLHSQSLMCLECFSYFQRTDLGYPLTSESVGMALISLPIFSCALKFALIYLMRTDAKRVWDYLEYFTRTPQFCSLVECVLLIFQYESATCSEQHVEIMKFISWVSIKESFDRLPITLSLLESTFREELARREKIFGLDNDRFRTWESFIDIFIIPPERGQLPVSGLHKVEGNIEVKGAEIISSNQVDRPSLAMGVEAREAAKHIAMLKIGNLVAAKAPTIQALARAVPKLTSIVPELLPIPFLILLAIRESNPAREEQYWSSALERLTGANNFFEAFCANQLGVCRYSKDEEHETLLGLYNRSREILMDLPSSLHVDILYCNTLHNLALTLLHRDQEVQEIVSELQRRLSNGPTKGYISTHLERKLYRPLFWDDLEAMLLVIIVNGYANKFVDILQAKALSIVDSNIQLYKDPGPRRVEASILAHHAKAKALYWQWRDAGHKMPCELARESEAACRKNLQLAKFPNPAKYSKYQWWMLVLLCTLLYRQCRYPEVKELISRIPTDFPPTWIYGSICIAATAACLGDLETGEALLDRGSLKIQGQQASLLRSEPEHVANLIMALVKVRPILRLLPLVSLCWRHVNSKYISEGLCEQDFWYRYVEEVYFYWNPCVHELWDVFYIRYLALVADDGYTRCPQFASACEKFAFEYARRQNHEAAAVVSRYLISYTLQRNPIDQFPWSLYYTALYLHFRFRAKEALALFRSMLFWIEKCAPCEEKYQAYESIKTTCLEIGDYHEENGNPLYTEFYKLAAASRTGAMDTMTPSTDTEEIERWSSTSQFPPSELGFALANLKSTDSPHINPNIKDRDGIPRHQSYPDLRAGYVKEVYSHRTAYSLWRKRFIRRT
ncbi:hypothetical protein GGR58DRAFT_500980 [Xylaria digitata]|nr:hypothetical protein GGR58DRAFT_500980 [Xylaria digitata]